MEELKKYIEDIWDELNGAKHYAKKAMHCKDYSNQYTEMARQELSHAEKLMGMAESYVERYEMENSAPAIKMIWTWEKERLLERHRDIKMMIDSTPR